LYPENWFNIKQKLETGIPIEKNYVKYDEYEVWCAEEQYNDPIRRRNLLRILDSVGAIVFFDKPVLNELQVLNPEWISAGAYAIITAELTRQKKGHLTWQNLLTIFNDEKEMFYDKHIKIKYEEPQFKFILELMLDYRLCQKSPFVEHEYLIPAAFGEKPDKQYDISLGRHFRLKFNPQFEMLIIHQFIAKNITHIVSNDYWNSGIYFKHASSSTYALVETNQYSRVIDCWIEGENIIGMWEVIRNDFRDIFNMYHNFVVDEEVEYITGGRSFFFKYDEMLTALNNGVLVIPYDPKTGLKNIDVIHILDLFESSDQSQRIMSNELAKKETVRIEVNPNITVTNNPIFNNGYIEAEHQKGLSPKPLYDKMAEDLFVRKWKTKALISFILSFIITSILITIYLKKAILEPAIWTKLEKYDIIKWTGILIGVAWDGFILKVLYDRFFNHSMEEAYRRALRK